MTPNDPNRPLAVGDVLHGFCGGLFGRDHYDCSRVEAIGSDWVVVRSGDPDYADGLDWAVGANVLEALKAYRDVLTDWCPADPCPVQPNRAE